MPKENYESMTLDEWFKAHPDEESRRSIFLNLDRALKYIHDHGYCIEVFYPTEIEVLNNDENYIQFKKLMELSTDPVVRKNMISEDIFHSGVIQVGMYTDCLDRIVSSPEQMLKYLKENFDDFAQFIPQGDIPYYRGVIQRGASVYFCEYALEKRNRDLEDLEKQLGDEGTPNVAKLVKETSITNDEINDVIYRQINGYKDAAFVNWLLIPTVVLGMLVLFGIITWVSSLFG